MIRDMSRAYPLWGAPRVVGELRKHGIKVAKSTVEKYWVRPRKPPSLTWKVFLNSLSTLKSFKVWTKETVLGFSDRTPETD